MGDVDAMREIHDAALPDECNEFAAFHAKGSLERFSILVRLGS